MHKSSKMVVQNCPTMQFLEKKCPDLPHTFLLNIYVIWMVEFILSNYIQNLQNIKYSKIFFQCNGHFTQKCIPFLVEADVSWIAPMTHHSFVKLCIWPAAWYWSWSTLIKIGFSPMGQIWTPPPKGVGQSWTPFLIILKALNFGKQLFTL